MSKMIFQTLVACAVASICGTSNAGERGCCHYVRYTHSQPVYHTVSTTTAVSVSTPATINSRVDYKPVQPTAKYDLSRPEVVSGSRVTLFANFLRQEIGCVLFNLKDASMECEVLEWRSNSVTVELPRLGLLAPTNAEVQIILPDGRIAKTFRVVYVSQPDVVVHSDSIPQPMPPAPASSTAAYAVPIRGGIVLQAE